MRIDEVQLSTDEEWLVRNALLTYREQCSGLAARERRAAEDERTVGNVGVAEQLDALADTWERTVERVRALEERLG